MPEVCLCQFKGLPALSIKVALNGWIFLMMKTSHGQEGFTLIEIVLVIAILGVLAAIAVPKFVDLSEGAHDAAAKAMHGGFSSAVNIIQAEWQARGSSSVSTSASGWPNGTGGPPMNITACQTVWTDILTSAPPSNLGYLAGADGWGIFGGGNFCFYIYQPDTTRPYHIIRYNVVTGLVEYLLI